MQVEIDFENDIRCVAETDQIDISENEAVNEIAEIVKGGVWQKTCNREFGDYLLYGKMDVWTPFKIYDIKHTAKLKIMKYKYSIQYLVYMYCTGVKFFDYLISDRKELMIELYNYDEYL